MGKAPVSKRQKRKAQDHRGKLRSLAKLKQANSEVKGKRSNRNDGRRVSTATMGEMVSSVKDGGVRASGDFLDARSLANLLSVKDSATGKVKLSAAKIAELPEQKADVDDLNRQLDAEDEEAKRLANAPQTTTNQYARRGASHLIWERLGVADPLREALREMHFTHATPIQQKSLPTALEQPLKSDIVVSAETGSGKTLVFALPILNDIARNVAPRRIQGQKFDPKPAPGKRARVEEEEEAEDGDEEEDGEDAEEGEEAEKEYDSEGLEVVEDDDDDEEEEVTGVDPLSDEAVGGIRVLHSLILTPTRELALQIDRNIKQLAAKIPWIRSGCIVGGMAPTKQQRILNRMPDVLICTPGRIWELLQQNEGCFLGHSLSRRLSYLVLDEADRLLQSGRFEELKKILERVRCDILPSGVEQSAAGELEEGTWDEEQQQFIPKRKDLPSFSKLKDRPRPMPMPAPPADDHRTAFFVTSATLSLQVNYQNRNVKEKQIIRTKNADTMQSVLRDLELNPKRCEVFDIAPEAGVVSKITETYLRCPHESKELYLYYFLKTFEGRTIIFVNAISMLRRLVKLFEVLQVPAGYLHAAMQQRQRLKFIDKFRSGERPVLIATDVASRGLDVDDVRHVIHFQIPRSTDSYIHRCGRTARCGTTGFSALFVDPSEFTAFKKLQDTLKRTVPMEVFAVNHTVLRDLHGHLRVATQIDKLSKEVRKSSVDQGWLKRMSRDADIEATDMLDESLEEENRGKRKAIKQLQTRLSAMVRQQLDVGAKGAFRSAPKALGAQEATDTVAQRATRQLAHSRRKAKKG